MQNNKQLFESSLNKVQQWVERHHYKGFEPSDGLSSYWRPLTFNNLLLQRVLAQLIWKFPVNIRAVMGVPPLESTKGRGWMVRGYMERFLLTKDPSYKDKAILCLEWLMENKSPGQPYFCWGNSFEFATRGGYNPRYTPTIVWTSHIGQAFLDAYKVLKEKRFLDVAENICSWILNLPRETTDAGLCLSYTPLGQSSIHNSNMLGAAMLARTATFVDKPEMRKVAAEAMKYSCTRQLSDGAWYYGEEQTYHWIDNFHTGYNLDCLKLYQECTKDLTWEKNLEKGLKYFKKTFFEPSGRPRYYHNSTYPIDIQCASQAIETLVNFAGSDPEALDMAQKVAVWTIKNMQDRDGHFYYRILPPGIKNKAPMLHWGQATMFRALAMLIKALDQC